MSVTVYAPSAPPDVEVERRIRVDLARRNPVYFTVYYLRDDDGQPFHLAPFHSEWLNLCASDLERVLILGPAAHGKTTLVVKAYAVYLICNFPDVRIKLGCKNSGDAEARLFSIKQELENNERLIEDYGTFVSDKWRETEINVRQRTIRDIEPTIRAFGSEASIIGARATHLILDDIVTEQNSGMSVEDGTRAKLSTNFNTAFKKLGYPKKRLFIRWVNTVVDLRDLVHEYAAVHGQMPDDGRTEWKSTKNFHVWHRRALDETTGETIWPEGYPLELALKEKAEDLISFLKRMQNLCLDPSTLNFQRAWFDGDANAMPPMPGCLDFARVLQADPPARDNARYVKAAGYDPNPGTSENSKYCAYAEVMFDREQQEPHTYYVTDLARFRAPLPEQERFIVDRALNRNPALIYVEANVQNQWLLQLPGMQSAVKAGYRIEPHYTSVKNKPDPETGVPSIAGIVRAGLLRFAYGDIHSRELAEIAIGEFLTYPQGATSDVLMAIWFAILAAKKVTVRKGLRIHAPALPGWLNRGARTSEQIERWYPGMRPR